MAKFYSLIVIGSGTAATVTASEIRSAGWSVAVVDYRPLGGTCALRGCDPKKILVSGIRALDYPRRMAGKGVSGDVSLDWSKLQDYKRAYVEPIPEKRQRSYRDMGIDTYQGHAFFSGPRTIEVNQESLQAEYILIATGAEPVELDFPGAEYLITSDEFLNLPELPKRIVFVGGGYIAAEFSHIAASAGSDVTVVQRGPRMLKHFDPDMVDLLMESFLARGIDVITQAEVESVEKSENGGFLVNLASGRFKDTVEADMLVHAAGRRPSVGHLGVEAGEVEMEQGRLRLNEFLQSTSNPAVFAAGDAAQLGAPLTPVSSHDAHLVAANMLMGTHRKPDYKAVPSVAFTLPPIASVGLGEQQAREQGLRFHCKYQKTGDWFSSYESAEPTAGFKVLTDDINHRILGAHLVGHRADEIINVFALAMRHGLTADQLKGTMFAYPTGASDISSML